MTSIKADKKLLLLILVFLLLFAVTLVVALVFIVKKDYIPFVVTVVMTLFSVFSFWITLYFNSVEYEKGDSYIKITSGILVKKYTFIRRENPLVVVNYHLPFGTGFAVVYIYGGTQIIFSRTVI